MIEPRRFRLEVADAEVADLRQRVDRTRWPDDPDNSRWDYGVERDWLKSLTDYWVGEFDWRAQERAMNGFPNYMVEVDGQPIHFLHVKGTGSRPVPLILTHGWPWTFWDWKDVIGPLTDPAAYGGDPDNAFDVVIPSLPGIGFSVPLVKSGFGARRIADTWHRLMTEILGYERYGAGGGDFGSIVTGEIGHSYGGSASLIGIWLTLPYVPGTNLRELRKQDFAPDEHWMWDRMVEASPTIQAHRTVHQIEPQTIAYGLTDSPVGTAGWILGRRRDWGDHRGDVFATFDRDFLCATASIYWLNRSIGSSMRIYSEQFKGGGPPPPLHDRQPAIEVPTAFSIFPKELLLLPRSLAERTTNVQFWRTHERGGHFAPAEVPELVVEDLRDFFRPLR